MQPSNDKEKAILLCHRSIEMVNHFSLVPTPQNYELFFLYASGDHKELTNLIDEKLSSGGTLVQDDLDTLYKRWVGDASTHEGLGLLGGRLADEVREALALVKEAAISTTDFSGSLADIETRLGDFSDPEQVREALSALVSATRHMSEDSLALKGKLAASTEHIQNLQQELQDFRAESRTDALTGIANRKYFDQQLAIAISEAEQSGEPLCLSMVDIDHFKRFNDKFGHQTGDSVLRLVSDVLKNGIKHRDLAARYGGEEFAIILRNVDMKIAADVAEELRVKVNTRELVRKSTSECLGHISASFGIEQYRPGDTPETLVARADQNLYKAKHAGRNRVVAARVTEQEGTEGSEHAA